MPASSCPGRHEPAPGRWHQIELLSGKYQYQQYQGSEGEGAKMLKNFVYMRSVHGPKICKISPLNGLLAMRLWAAAKACKIEYLNG
jgi:hypothetical protein